MAPLQGNPMRLSCIPKEDITMFHGFSPETVDFLWGIRMNNNREWFLEHKQDYVNHLYEPMKALGADLFNPFLDKPGCLLKVSRIYRDARLHHPLPYKESLWICIRQDVPWWGENSCLYFEITPDGISYGFALWKPRVSTLEAMRREWADRPEEFIDLIARTEAATGVPITAEYYKRPKEAPMEALQRFYAWKSNIGCTVTEEFSPQVFGPELGRRVGDFLQKLIPLYDYFTRFQV